MAEKNRLHPIPKPPGKPLVGNMLSVDPDAPLQKLMQISEEQGPIFWLDMMGSEMVIVSGADLVKELCDESRFGKVVRGPLRRVRAIGGDGLFTGDSDDPNWAKAHNILMPTFSQKAMVDYLPMMIDIADQLMLKWERLNADEEIDVVRDMTGLTLDTIGLCGFDYRFNSFYREDFHPFIDALGRTLETCMLQRGLPFEKVALRKRMQEMGDDVAFMNKLVDDIIRERRRGGGDQAQKDLLNFMLAGVDKVTGESLSDENIRYQINTFLIAGHETTSGLLSFTMYYLLNNPDVLEKAYAEVDKVLGNNIAVPPTYAQIGELVYTRAILMEALRLWPTAPAFSLAPYEDEVIGGKYKLKKGTFTTILIPSLHRDKTYWGDDPEAFNPDNFLPDAEAARPDYAYKPFGNGKRACIGRQFAIQEAVLVLAMILQRFELFDHKNYQLKIKETLSLKPDGFTMKVKLRDGIVRTPVASAEDQGAAAAATEARRPKHGTKLTVLYGSNLGTAEGFARDIAQSGDINGFETILAPLDDFVGNLPTEGAVVIVCASYNGAPPDNAVQFCQWLDDAGDLSGVHYSVFGCGSRDWASTFQSVPRMIDERLAALGATRLADKGEADAREDMDGQFHSWFDPLFGQIGDAFDLGIDFSQPVDAQPLYKVELAESVTANPVAAQAGTIPMKIVENQELQNHEGANPSTRSTRHIEIELPEGVTYEPGDHLCVVPKNSDRMVKRALDRFGYSEDTYIRVDVTGGRRSPFPNGSTFSLKRLAQVYGELQAVASRKDVAKLAAHTRCPETKPKLEALAAPAKGDEDLYRSEVFLKRKSLLDLLEEFPACELPFEVFLEMVPWLTPRFYSISSSMKATPGRVTITVGVVKGPALSGNGAYEGVCSCYLEAAQPGMEIQASVREPSAGFRLPEDAGKPIIMVGPGTGIAPFRAFIQERRALGDAGATLGPAMLFFGCRHPDQDYLYREELEAAEADGIIELNTAFSRSGPERVYVQDLIRKQGARVWQMLEDGAIVYICGDGSAMEPDVKRTLQALYAEEKDVTLEAAEGWLESMVKDGRYVLDVWAGN